MIEYIKLLAIVDDKVMDPNEDQISLDFYFRSRSPNQMLTMKNVYYYEVDDDGDDYDHLYVYHYVRADDDD